MKTHFITTMSLLLSLFISTSVNAKDKKEIKQPYPSISGSFSGEKVAYSPDPLVNYRWNNPSATDDLEIYTTYPISVTADEQDNYTINKDLSHIRVTGDCSLMFDFGRVNGSWLEFDSDNLQAEIEMSISEFNEPAVFNAGSQHPKKTTRPVKYGNTYRLELNKELYEGVRFGWIHIHKLNIPADIRNVRLICQVKPTNYEGSFACSDTMLTRIWYTGAYTVKTNLLKDYFGAILMERSDRHSWTGDAHTSQAASMVAFGNYDFVKTNLRYTSTQYNGIATYSIYWVLSLIDYYNYTGDKELLNEMLENVCYKLDLAYNHYEENPTLSFSGWDERLGAGFENPENDESRIHYKLLSIRAWNEFSNVLAGVGNKQLAAKYKKYATDKMKGLRKSPQWIKQFSLHSASEGINGGFLTKKELDKVWTIAFSDRQQRLSYSPFNQFFVIKALGNINRHAEALNTIDDCWGGQIRYGATTFFEVYRPSWNDISNPNDAPANNQCGYTSFTHPWSAGVTKWLSEEILGIKPTKPGFKSCIIKPVLSSKVSWVKGGVPTLHGTINSYFNIENGQCDLDIPSNITATVGIPKAGKKIQSIDFKEGDWKKTKEDAEYIWFELSGGQYKAVVNYTGHIKEENQEAFYYALNNKVKEDTSTKGDWINKYGKKGYVLCNYDSTGTHQTSLPDFVEEFKMNKTGNIHWTSNSSDPRALASLNSQTKTRKLGAVITRDPNPCDQTMTFDIKPKINNEYTVSLYFVDWDNKNRRSAIEIFDLESKKLLMPVYMVRDYQDGKYVTFTFDQPIRIRIDQVRGENAALSGIFFD